LVHLARSISHFETRPSERSSFVGHLDVQIRGRKRRYEGRRKGRESVPTYHRQFL
jgi:hypothetical protein